MMELIQWSIEHKEAQSCKNRGCWRAATAFLGARPRSAGTPSASGCCCSRLCSYSESWREISDVWVQLSYNV